MTVSHSAHTFFREANIGTQRVQKRWRFLKSGHALTAVKRQK